ncbi:MAG: co-chaperone GroES [Proteobacteria bacterium]|nr:co-chaperone GroES [Pseudomonadota bacterium]MBU1716650.1 co-chaperone GroES [Pseudomonadota bacterium]
MKIRPLNDRILVKRLKEEEVSKGGIIIPDSAKEKPAEGKVIAVGTGKLNDKGVRVPVELKVGDSVLFSKYGGTDVKLDGEDYLIMREDDILGVIEK